MTQGESIITLCKYDEYNPLFISNNTPDNTPDNTPPEPVTSCKRDGCNPPFFDDNTPDNTPLNTPVTHPYHTGNTNTNKGNKVKKEKKEKESIPDGICRDAPDAVPVSFKNFIAGFNAVRGSKFQAIEKARRQFNARLKEGFTPDQMIQALKTAMKEKNHIESGYKYLTPEFITRPDKLERFLNSNAGKGERMSEEDFLKRLNGE
ncbi:MAG: conserved phage C-terminal domain-containing protein [Tannerella sp.]|nr:conserved phage C-terminal domain-containing protein [Tannerella sp.]